MTVLAEGTQGHLTGAAIERFGLAGDNPQVWALGVKEVWRVAKPLDRVIHTMGWPLRGGARYREFGGSFIYPMGEDQVALGMVVGLDYRDAELSVHDLLQELKTHQLVRKILEGGERVEWGAKTIPEGGFLALPKRLHAPGAALLRRRRRDGQRAGAEGDPLRDRVRPARGGGRVRGAAARDGRAATPGALASYDGAVRDSYIWRDLEQVRNMRPAFSRGFWVGGALAGMMTATRGKLPPLTFRTERDADVELIVTDRAKRYPAPDGKLTFDKLSSVFLSGNKTRDDQPNHIRIQTQGAARARRAVGAHVPGARVRGRPAPTVPRRSRSR